MPGFWEIVLLLAVAVIVIGPQQLPEIARTWGVFFARIRQATASARREVENAIDPDAQTDLQVPPTSYPPAEPPA
jgi:sec-independent protein translocase protein TatB